MVKPKIRGARKFVLFRVNYGRVGTNGAFWSKSTTSDLQFGSCVGCSSEKLRDTKGKKSTLISTNVTVITLKRGNDEK